MSTFFFWPLLTRDCELYLGSTYTFDSFASSLALNLSEFVPATAKKYIHEFVLVTAPGEKIKKKKEKLKFPTEICSEKKR